MSEAAYRRITYDYTLATGAYPGAAEPGLDIRLRLRRRNQRAGPGDVGPGQGARSRNDVLALDLDAYMFRPGLIQPRHGITSKTKIYRIVYGRGARRSFPVLRLIAPKLITTTELVGRAMLKVAGQRFGQADPDQRRHLRPGPPAADAPGPPLALAG